MKISSLIVALAIGLSACSVMSAPHATVQGRLSLIGELPQRIAGFHVRVDAPDMAPIEAEAGANARSLQLEIPAGRGRRISVIPLADIGDGEIDLRPDVYTGTVTARFAPGSEATVRIPIVPGPVIPVYNSESLLQLRAVSIEPGLNPTESRQKSFEDLLPVDAVYDHSGSLWVSMYSETAAERQFHRYDSLDFPAAPSLVSDTPLVPQAIAYDPQGDRLFISGSESLSDRLIYSIAPSVSAITVSLATDEPLWRYTPSGGSLSISHVLGMAPGTDGELFVLFRVTSNDMSGHPGNELFNGFSGLVLIRIANSGETVAAVEVPADILAPPVPGTVYADLKRIGSRLMVIVADPIEEYGPILKYDLDLQLLESFGQIGTAGNPGEFWGPRRFVASRNQDDLLIIDQQIDGAGRVVEFAFGDTSLWNTYFDESLQFYNQ